MTRFQCYTSGFSAFGGFANHAIHFPRGFVGRRGAFRLREGARGFDAFHYGLDGHAGIQPLLRLRFLGFTEDD